MDQISRLDEHILRPYQKILKFMGIPVLCFVGVVIYVFLRGFSTNKYLAELPAVINLGFPLWLVLLSMLVLFIIIALIIRFYKYDGIDYCTRLKLSGNEIIIETDDYIITFKISKAKRIKFSELHLFHLLYNLYMVGRLTINYEGDKYRYYFPVKSPAIERQIRKWIKK